MYKALRSFTGKVSMFKDEIKEINDKELADDLLKSGYIVEIEVPKKIDFTGKPIEDK